MGPVRTDERVDVLAELRRVRDTVDRLIRPVERQST
jgi:hypothetical protein